MNVFQPVPVAPVAPKAYQRYPLVMHKGEWPGIQSKHVQSADEEADAKADGWGHERPAVPEPVPEKPVLTMEERVSALEEQFAALGKKKVK